MIASVRGSLGMLLLFALTLLGACSLSQTAHARKPAPQVHYRVEIPAPHRQYVHVAMEVKSPGRAPLSLAMPSWTPGSYLVRDHAKHVYDLRAEASDGTAVPVRKLDKQTWKVEHGGRNFTAHYRVFAAEASVRTSHVDDTHASLIGTSIFLYLRGHLERPATVDIALPPGWSAHTALPSTAAPKGHARFSATDYDTLVDSPIELGTPDLRRFRVQATDYEYVVTGAQGTAIDIDRLADEAEKVVRAQAELMGGLPMPRYLFLLRVSERGGGGLEHGASTSMMMSRSAFDRDSGYMSAARLAGHEHFHLWNVKRLHDRVLGPFDYRRESHSRLLWFHEGFTETIEGLGLLRAELLDPTVYLKDLATRWTRYLTKPGRNHESIAQISFDAWTKAYKPEANHPNVAISYYEKGEYIGIALDIELRLRSARHGHQGSLPAVFRRLMTSHGQHDRGLSHADIIAAASAEAGEDMQWFFDRYVEGTEELPLPDLLAQIGITVQTTAPWLDDDGTLREPLTTQQRRARVYSGIVLSNEGSIRNVIPDSPADKAGLMRGDQLLAIDGLRADKGPTARTRLSDHAPGDTATVSLYRDGRLLSRTLTFSENPARTYRFSLTPKAELSDDIVKLRDAWLATSSQDTETAAAPTET